ncbi:hypothetical protein DNTS_032811 [Danionella cerebrum]|uniref:RETREG1-3/ARL6IP-like N-terminal reticulon-homology domain-containing protein n=1 Tax=Danionella cerebrum TaxID=2873325 RepID=A0A553PXQ4_9TELE|nr:hypothetical protein DNTS_032811 [Danionella translucida]
MTAKRHCGPPKLERLDSVMSHFSGSLVQNELQDTLEDLDISGQTDLCGGQLLDCSLAELLGHGRSCVAGVYLFRWLVVKDSFVLYMRPEDGQVGTVILYDKGFHIKIGTREAGVRHGVTIENLCRQESFVNAAGYFDSIADALEEAKEEIFITAWCRPFIACCGVHHFCTPGCCVSDAPSHSLIGALVEFGQRSDTGKWLGIHTQRMPGMKQLDEELSVLLWPLVVYHELIQKVFTRLEPILMKRDYSMKGDTQRHKKNGNRPPSTEDVDVKTTALAMAITDSELSDEEASILESHHTTAHRCLFDFPLGVFGSEHTLSEEEDAMTPASLLIQHLASPLHFVNTHFNGYGQAVGAPNQSIVDLTETSTEDQSDVTLVPAEEEDFELLDQSELEQMDEGLDLGGDEQEAGRASANMPLSCQQLAEPKVSFFPS